MFCKDEGKCFPVKTICFVLGILNAVGNALLLLWCCGMGLLWYIDNDLNGSRGSWGIKMGGIRFKREVFHDTMVHGPKPETGSASWRPWQYWLPILAVVSLLTFIFSVLLCVGISKHRPKYVEAYLMYGSVLSAFAVMASLILFYPMLKPMIAIWSLFGCALHSLFLVLVHRTRAKLGEVDMTDHVRLEEIAESTL